MSLVDFIQYNNVVVGQGRIRRHLTEDEPFRDKDDTGGLRLTLLESDLVAHLRAKLVERLVCYTLGQGDASDPPWLRADDP